jgi:hypothetical protein
MGRDTTRDMSSRARGFTIGVESAWATPRIRLAICVAELGVTSTGGLTVVTVWS